MTLAKSLEGLPPAALQDASATAIFYMSQTALQNIFKFKLQSDVISDSNARVIKYYTFMNYWPTNVKINPSNGMLDQPDSLGAISNVDIPTQMLIKHDFVRYLAEKLFGTYMATDLFSNQSELIDTLSISGNDIYQNDISGILWKYSATNRSPQISSSYVLDGSSNFYYTTDLMTTNDNIGRELLQQMLHFNVGRFSNLTPDRNNLISLPILSGDNINFNYTINPAPDQNELTGVPPIPGRIYKIKIIVDDGTHSNTIPVD
jgi:hypothetical protein